MYGWVYGYITLASGCEAVKPVWWHYFRNSKIFPCTLPFALIPSKNWRTNCLLSSLLSIPWFEEDLYHGSLMCLEVISEPQIYPQNLQLFLQGKVGCRLGFSIFLLPQIFHLFWGQELYLKMDRDLAEVAAPLEWVSSQLLLALDVGVHLLFAVIEWNVVLQSVTRLGDRTLPKIQFKLNEYYADQGQSEVINVTSIHKSISPRAWLSQRKGDGIPGWRNKKTINTMCLLSMWIKSRVLSWYAICTLL